MDPTQTLDGKYSSGKYLTKPSTLAADLVDIPDPKVLPVAPSLRMKNTLNGTNTPSATADKDVAAWRLKDEDNLQETFPEIHSENHRNLTRNVASPTTAPTLGDFSNLKPPYFLDYDPNVKSTFKGIVYISESYTETPADLRHKDARFTAYDSRNDPAWHYVHGIASYDILGIVKTGIVPVPVKNIEDLGATDNHNKLITQDYLRDSLDWLNGHNTFNGLSARNTTKYTVVRQRAIGSKVRSGNVQKFVYTFITEKFSLKKSILSM